MNDPITIRASTEEDRGAILRLAALDSRPAPAGDVLLAFAGAELRAALPLDGGAPLADPFQPTAAVVDLLRVRAGRTGPRGREQRSRGLRALRPRAA